MRTVRMFRQAAIKCRLKIRRFDPIVRLTRFTESEAKGSISVAKGKYCHDQMLSSNMEINVAVTAIVIFHTTVGCNRQM